MSESRSRRILFLISPQSYRNQAFLDAGKRAGIEVTQAIDVPDALAREWGIELGVEFSRPDYAVSKLLEFVKSRPVDAVLALDDSATLIASRVAGALGLPHNDSEAAVAARDKWIMRQKLHSYQVPAPQAVRFELETDQDELQAYDRFPCVVKPSILSGSRGVIRANDTAELLEAFARTQAILRKDGYSNETASIVVEDYIPGVEVALEGILTEGALTVLALFDKPDPLVGPFFEETIYTTPSTLTVETQDSIAECTERAAAALGLKTGPVHAELRVNDSGPWIVEIAGRSIGGLCSTILEFGTGHSLEELIVRHAVGEPIDGENRAGEAVGVMMIPIPKAGILREVTGVSEAAATPGVTGVEISARLNHPIVPLPEGSSYLGFIFARGATPGDVETSLRQAHEKLHFRITSQIKLSQAQGSESTIS